MPGLARVCACPRFPSILARAFIANSCSVGRGRLGCYRSFIPWHRPRPLCSWLIMSPDSFAPAFAFACSRLSDSEPLRAAPSVAALAALACSRSASMQEALQRVCVLFVFIFTKISIILSILYPKTYKMHVISHFLRIIFGSFKKKHYLCSAFEKIK